jgi:adhesin transport system membrane fusion protein
MASINRDDWIATSGAEGRGSIFSHLLLVLIAVLVVVFVVWANYAVLDQVTRGDGRVIPASHTQVIQNLEGGIVSEILVNEGDIVDKGQVLLRIDNTLAESTAAERRQRYLSTLAAVARLQAEVDGTPLEEISFPEELKEAPEIVQAERSLYEVRHEQIGQQGDILREQVKQKQQEIAQLSSRLKGAKKAAANTAKRLEIQRPLAAEGVVSKNDILELEREYDDAQADIESTSASLAGAQAALAEAKTRLQEPVATFRREAAQELNEKRVELASLSETLTADVDRVSRTEVRSPVRGQVKQLKIRTVGGVIQPGQDIMEITPIEDTLLVEAQVRPSDIAFVHPGQRAMVKVTAYDFSIYGGLDASVEDISADTIQNEEGESFFRVRLRTDKNSLGNAEKPLQIIPGMTTTVDILTGHKTVLDYLLKPILKARENALRER